MSFTIQKADGTSEYFKVEKLRRSLRRAGATPAEVTEVIRTIELRLYDGIRTQEIYRLAFEILRDIGAPIATRYSLRRALLGLGPTGFPFELFLAKLFEADGYKTQTGIILNGHCAPHEIDIAAYKSDHSFIGEAKFHSRPGIKTDLQVAMYSYARLLDLRDQQICQEDICGIKEFWLITNTKFTTTAEDYAHCAGVHMLSWDYPRNNNLHDRIQRAGIYPITVLQSLAPAQRQSLIASGVITCQDLLANERLLHQLHLGKDKHQAILEEADGLIKHTISAHKWWGCQPSQIWRKSVIICVLFHFSRYRIMTDVQKEESQKTVISFVFGLLVGGLLVWAFMGDGKDHDKMPANEEVETTATTTANDETTETTSEAVVPNLQVGEGKVTVASGKAGREVTLGETVYPIEEGWIGVREYNDGKLGWINGVIRFSKAGNLVPTTIPLVQPTVAGREYAIVMFTEAGDKTFNSATDKQVDTIFATFTAE